MKNEGTLTSLAMLKVNINSGKDYLDYLNPFVIQALLHGDLELVNDKTVADRILKDCGLVIPRRTVQIVLQRFVKAGHLKKENKVFIVINELPEKNYSADKVAATRSISSVVESLIGFAKIKSAREISEDEAIHALIDFLAEFYFISTAHKSIWLEYYHLSFYIFDYFSHNN